MDRETQRARAIRFRDLHQGSGILVLVNAWDAASACIFEKAGCTAIATSSAGVAASLGFADEDIPVSLMLEAVARIAAAVSLPVSADMEAGFGDTAADIIIAASFSVLSILPAVLLHISLESHHRTLWMSGYVLSLTAVTLHVVDLLTRAPRFHYAALLLVTLGFAWLTVIFIILEMRQRNRAAISRLAGAMVLFYLRSRSSISAPSTCIRPGPKKLLSIMRAYRWRSLCFCKTTVSSFWMHSYDLWSMPLWPRRRY